MALKTAIDFYSHFSSLWRNLTLSLPAKRSLQGVETWEEMSASLCWPELKCRVF